MEKITHISVRPADDAEPAAALKIVYVEPPAPDALDAKPFASGRHRLERSPGADERPASTLWSWTEGDD